MYYESCFAIISSYTTKHIEIFFYSEEVQSYLYGWPAWIWKAEKAMHRGLIFIPINTRRCIHKLNFSRNNFLRFVHDELLRHEVFYAYSRKHRIDRELLHRWVMWSMDLLFKLSSFYSKPLRQIELKMKKGYG